MKRRHLLLLGLPVCLVPPASLLGQTADQLIAEEVLVQIEQRRKSENGAGADITRILLNSEKASDRGPWDGSDRERWDDEFLTAVLTGVRRRGVEALSLCRDRCVTSRSTMLVKLSQPQMVDGERALATATIQGLTTGTSGYVIQIRYRLRLTGGRWRLESAELMYHARTRKRYWRLSGGAGTFDVARRLSKLPYLLGQKCHESIASHALSTGDPLQYTPLEIPRETQPASEAMNDFGGPKVGVIILLSTVLR